MKVQIYTMQSVEEAVEVSSLGVDHLGITPSNIGLPGEIDFDTARNIVEAVGKSAVCVALTVESNPDAIVSMVQFWYVFHIKKLNHIWIKFQNIRIY